MPLIKKKSKSHQFSKYPLFKNMTINIPFSEFSAIEGTVEDWFNLRENLCGNTPNPAFLTKVEKRLTKMDSKQKTVYILTLSTGKKVGITDVKQMKEFDQDIPEIIKNMSKNNEKEIKEKKTKEKENKQKEQEENSQIQQQSLQNMVQLTQTPVLTLWEDQQNQVSFQNEADNASSSSNNDQQNQISIQIEADNASSSSNDQQNQISVQIEADNASSSSNNDQQNQISVQIEANNAFSSSNDHLPRTDVFLNSQQSHNESNPNALHENTSTAILPTNEDTQMSKRLKEMEDKLKKVEDQAKIDKEQTTQKIENVQETNKIVLMKNLNKRLRKMPKLDIFAFVDKPTTMNKKQFAGYYTTKFSNEGKDDNGKGTRTWNIFANNGTKGSIHSPTLQYSIQQWLLKNGIPLHFKIFESEDDFLLLKMWFLEYHAEFCEEFDISSIKELNEDEDILNHIIRCIKNINENFRDNEKKKKNAIDNDEAQYLESAKKKRKKQ